MKYFKIAARMLGLLLLACMLSVCLVMGIVPVLPKRKEQAPIEIKIEETEKEGNNTVHLNDIIL